MHPQVQEYINRIIDNDETLTVIDIENQQITDDDLAPLITILNDNPVASQRITYIGLRGNNLTIFNAPILPALERLMLSNNNLTALNISNLPALERLDVAHNQLRAITLSSLPMLDELFLSSNQLGTVIFSTPLPALTDLYLENNELTAFTISALNLPALVRLYLEGNRLTIATKIALSAEVILLGRNIRIFHNNQLPADAALTTEILDEHFEPMLQVNPDDAIGYLKCILKSIGATQLMHMPAELLTLLNKMLSRPEIASAQASMINFQDTFGRLAAVNANDAQLEVLNAYDARFEVLVNATESYYREVFNSIKAVIRARGAINRDIAAVLNKPSTINPVLFSSAPPAAEEARNNANSALIKRGFLLHKNGI